MEGIKNSDMDGFLLRMERRFPGGEKQGGKMTGNDYGMGFTANMPDGFTEESDAGASRAFPKTCRPQAILANPEANAGITFQILAQGDSGEPRCITETEELEALCGQVRKCLEKIDSRTVFYEAGQAGSEGRIRWMEYKSFAADERVYNLLFLFSTEKGAVMGTFYCIFKDYADWKPAILEMLGSIRGTAAGVAEGGKG